MNPTLHPLAEPTAEPSNRELRAEVLAMAWPITVEQFLYMAVNLADLMIAGYLDDATPIQAGLAMATFLNWIISTLFSAVGVGATAVVARATGAGDSSLARLATAQGLLLGSVLGLLPLGLSLLAAEPLMASMGLTGAAADFGATWLITTGWSWPLTGLTLVGTAALRGAGDARTPLLLMLAVNAVNTTLAVSLALGVGSAVPALGADGIALATAGARIFGGLAMVAILVGDWTRLNLSPSLPTLDPVMITRLLRVGLPNAVETSVAAVAMTVFYRLVAETGGDHATTTVAAHGLAVRIEGLSYLPGFAFAVSASSMVGRNLGAGRPQVAERAARQAFLLSTIVTASMAVLFAVAGGLLVSLFTDDTEVVALGGLALRVSALAQVGQGAAFVFAGALRGAGDTRWPMLSTSTGLLVVRLPGTALLGLGLNLGLAGAWAAMGLDVTLRGIMNWLRFRGGRWKSVTV